jgi:hypothetical protein
VADDVDTVEISLAENVVRAPMHPADQFEAFKAVMKATPLLPTLPPALASGSGCCEAPEAGTPEHRDPRGLPLR